MFRQRFGCASDAQEHQSHYVAEQLQIQRQLDGSAAVPVGLMQIPMDKLAQGSLAVRRSIEVAIDWCWM